MAKKDWNKEKEREKEKVATVLQLLRNQAALTAEQEKFCSSACVERFLRVKGGSVKKASKQLRACISWRESISTENLMADEFPDELAEGIAYVAGHDEESRPVMIFRIKQDYQRCHSPKQFIRLLIFTLEVSIGTMHKGVEQFIILFDASLFRSPSAFMIFLLTTLKIVGEYYPGRLHRAFLIDPPALFSCLWKGVRAFVELSPATMVVSSLDFEDYSRFGDPSADRRASSLRFSPSSSLRPASLVGSTASSRFTFTVSHYPDALKPWYLSLANTSASKVGPSAHPPPSSLSSPSLQGAALVSPVSARSSIASPAARARPRGGAGAADSDRRAGKGGLAEEDARRPRTPRPSFLQSPALFSRKGERSVRAREAFAPFLGFCRKAYDETEYRSMMRPPLGGLLSIVHPRSSRRHASLSQRF